MDFNVVAAVAAFLRERIAVRPSVGIICGSGLAHLADLVQQREEIPYEQIPFFCKSTVAGHAGRLVFGLLRGKQVVLMNGRFHPYEGHSSAACSLPVRVMKALHVKVLLVTNAAGGLNPTFTPGDLMLIVDHLNLPGIAGANPLSGANDERWGARFPPLNKAYDRRLAELVKAIGADMGMALKEGVYCMVHGPSYETPAEVRALRVLGADAVGMSTVHEVVVAAHMGLRVLAMSLITNSCVGECGEEGPSHGEVVAVGEERAHQLQELVSRVVEKLE